MEIIPKDSIAHAMELMRQMQQISNAQGADPATSTEAAWQQRKCRRLFRYPTLEADM